MLHVQIDARRRKTQCADNRWLDSSCISNCPRRRCFHAPKQTIAFGTDASSSKLTALATAKTLGTFHQLFCHESFILFFLNAKDSFRARILFRPLTWLDVVLQENSGDASTTHTFRAELSARSKQGRTFVIL